MGGNAVVRFKDKHPEDEEVPSRTEEIVDALVDEEEVVVETVTRVSVFGLEVMTIDGPPARSRTDEESEGRRRTDDRRG
jgi:hypothetical protein